MADVNAKVDINKFYEVARRDVASLVGGLSVNAAVIYNASGAAVTFFVYNYIDTVYWISAAKVLVGVDFCCDSHGDEADHDVRFDRDEACAVGSANAVVPVSAISLRRAWASEDGGEGLVMQGIDFLAEGAD